MSKEERKNYHKKYYIKHREEIKILRSRNAMIERCRNDKSYMRKGIKVCDEWKNKETGLKNWRKFVSPLVDEYKNKHPETPLNCHIHRIDNYRNYEPSNVIVVSPDEHRELTKKERKK